MRDDQYFKPGDKVMRVGDRPANTIPYKGNDMPKSSPQYGRVYCVEDFLEGPQFNTVMLVGFGGWRYWHGMKVGWPAIAFRKVEEIQLCVRAVKDMHEPNHKANTPLRSESERETVKT